MLTDYDQKRNVFEPGLSIIDVMMFNSVDEINKMLDNYELI
ncbi:MAG TPA: WbqC family protein [Bacteroidales bacterium]|nr:WbqC family protein [Bacteroidales bacterium]